MDDTPRRYATAIWDVSASRPTEALIVEGMSDSHVQQFEEKWKPELLKMSEDGNRLRASGVHATVVEDAHWSWSGKLQRYPSAKGYAIFVVEAGGAMQGIMMVAKGRQARDQQTEGLIYVEYLHVAPWNRPWIGRDPQFRAVGTSLFRFAVQFSEANGHGGRVGLHALPGAVKWYGEKLKMGRFGADSAYYGLEYFEYDTEQAYRFLRQVT